MYSVLYDKKMFLRHAKLITAKTKSAFKVSLFSIKKAIPDFIRNNMKIFYHYKHHNLPLTFGHKQEASTCLAGEWGA